MDSGNFRKILVFAEIAGTFLCEGYFISIMGGAKWEESALTRRRTALCSALITGQGMIFQVFADVTPICIYIAAADAALAEELNDLLTSNNFKVRIFNRGYDVAALMDNWPDVFVLDIKLPDINGLELCSWLKSHDSSNHIPVILMSEDSYLKLLAAPSHADDFVDKSMATSQLIDKINHCLAAIGTEGRD